MKRSHDSAGSHPGEDTIIAFALEELGENEREEVESHLLACEECRRSATSLRAAIEGYQRRERPEAPARVLVDLLAAQGGRSEGKRTRLLRFGAAPVALAASLLAAFFLTGFLAGRHTASAPEGTQADMERRAPLRQPLPEPPPISFETALAVPGDAVGAAENWLP